MDRLFGFKQYEIAGGNTMSMKDVISAIRKEAGITQEEMARRLCVTRQAVSRWETGVRQNGLTGFHPATIH